MDKFLMLDVYSCEDCGRAFAVEVDDEPQVCPVCEADIFEYSHTIKGELVDEK